MCPFYRDLRLYLPRRNTVRNLNTQVCHRYYTKSEKKWAMPKNGKKLSVQILISFSEPKYDYDRISTKMSDMSSKNENMVTWL